MNAKQRRQIERRLCHEVVFHYKPYTDFDEDDLDEEVQYWCNKNIGRENWRRDQGGWASRGYFFADQKHVTLFVLRWL